MHERLLLAVGGGYKNTDSDSTATRLDSTRLDGDSTRLGGDVVIVAAVDDEKCDTSVDADNEHCVVRPLAGLQRGRRSNYANVAE